ncbi:hypothetical protein [Embleya sp. NPDC059259]|uniref:hypothetical protein n=1 Tax=unclassified Embleya TaxID=2699296 RepID=UPI0036B76038
MTTVTQTIPTEESAPPVDPATRVIDPAGLTDDQLDGNACIGCGVLYPSISKPVGHVPGRGLVFVCDTCPDTPDDFHQIKTADLHDSGEFKPSFRQVVNGLGVEVYQGADTLPEPLRMALIVRDGEPPCLFARSSLTPRQIEVGGYLALSVWFHSEPGAYRTESGAILVPVGPASIGRSDA